MPEDKSSEFPTGLVEFSILSFPGWPAAAATIYISESPQEAAPGILSRSYRWSDLLHLSCNKKIHPFEVYDSVASSTDL